MRKRLTVNGHGRATHDLDDCSRPIVVEALEDGVQLREPGGMGNAITLTIRQWEEAQAVIRVHEVPEPKTPGQRVHAAELRVGLRSVEWEHLGTSERAAYEATAGFLGITEGE